MKQPIILVLLFLAANLSMSAQIKLPRLVRDSMILQRDRKINIWGWAPAGERVRVTFNGKTYRSAAGSTGKWMLQLPSMKAGGPYTMEIEGKNKIILHDVLIGDVWLCSGQSNMVHQMKLHSVRYADAVSGAHYPEIRQFWVPTLTDLQGPQDDLPAGYWKSANPEDVLEFSAVAYFFARDLYEKYRVPIGIINSSVGGTPIEAWTSEEGLKDFPSLVKTIEKNKDTAYINALDRRRMANKPDKPKPAGKVGWRQIGVPGYWEDQGLKNLDGVVWYRKEIDVPASMTGKPAKIFLGRIVNADVLYINDKEVGNTTYEYPQRRYVLSADILKSGKNLFVVRVTNTSGKGGFVPDKPYCLIAGSDTVDLKGYWEYKVGEVFVPRERSAGGFGFSAQNAPTALYNAMMAPLINYPIKGFLWYQGEANTGDAAGYAKLQPAMIADWRRKWKEGDIPFLYVQLPGFGDYNYLPSESGWAALREAQLQSLSVANTGMAVAIDLGEWNDIHPDRKRPVGDRLALAAEGIAYGENIVYSGPVYRSATISGGKIILSFTHTGGGLVTGDGEEPQEFAIAGADKKFAWANAKIEGEKVIVWNDEITDPKYVRYAWADDPVNPNLYNREGLPASPFASEPSSADNVRDGIKGLKDYYAGYFPIGVAVGPKDLQGDESLLIQQQYNSLTPENAMKMGPIHPQENLYHWDDADSIVTYAQRHHLRVRGHNLCWHNQAPGWLFKDSSGNQVTKELLLRRLKDHITAVVSRYKGKIYAWDVVNEAIADDSAHVMRPSLWYQICGDEFIEKAFEYAHAADPGAVLFYNDYNTEMPAKREKIYTMLKTMLAKGVPVNGIGLQAHWSVSTPTREELENSIRLFSSLGLQVQITELDISVYPGKQGGQMVKSGETDAAAGFTAEMEQQQLEKYKMAFDVFRKYSRQITGVTFWNVSDKYSWLDNRGKKNYPLLFDKDLHPKKAYHAVVDF